MRSLVILAVGFFGCATPTATRSSATATSELALLAPQSGRYQITRDGKPVGEERYTVTSSAGIWAVEGAISLSWPLDQVQRYRLEYDEKNRRPARFEIAIELLGETQRVRGECDGSFFRGEISGIVEPVTFEVAHGPGTMLDFGSPLFSALLFALLGAELESATPISVRSVVVPVPFLRPAVLLQELRFAGREAELRKLALGPSGVRPAAYWVRADGLPVKVKTWPDEGGAPFVYELEP